MLKQFSELFVFLSCCLNYLGEVEKLMAFLGIQEIGETLCPGVFILYQDLHSLLIIFQLRIYHLYILFVLAEKISEILEAFLYALS